MNEYAKILCKRIVRRKSNLCLIVTAVFILVFVLVMNIRMQPEIRNRFESQVISNNDLIKEYKEKLLNVSEDSEEYVMYKSTIELNQSFSDKYSGLIELYDNEDWIPFYEMYQNVLKEEKQIYINSMGDSNDQSFDVMSNSNNRELAYFEYLNEHSISYENQDYPIFALSFITAISQTILPMLALICCIYIISQVFTMDYYENIDVSELLPIGRKKKDFTKLILGIGISIFVFIFLLSVMFFISLCITGNTGFDYPLMVQECSTKIWKAVNVLSVWKEWFIIGILFYISTCFATYLLSKYIKEEVPLFLSMICVVICLAYLPKISGLLVPIAHYLPTTYLNFVKIVNGSIAIDYNINFNSTTAVIVLSTSILIQFLFIYIKIVRKKYEYISNY